MCFLNWLLIRALDVTKQDTNSISFIFRFSCLEETLKSVLNVELAFYPLIFLIEKEPIKLATEYVMVSK